MIIAAPYLILPPDPPALVRAHDLAGVPSWAEMRRRDRALREGTFPFPFFIPMASGACSCTPAYVTGNRTSSITVSLSSGMNAAMSDGPISKLVDGDTSADNEPYFSAIAVSGEYIRFQFGSATKITEAKYYQGGVGLSHGTWKWQGSNDASSWTDIGSSFTLGGGVTTQTQTELSGNTAGYTYYQLIGVSGNMSGSLPRHVEIEFKQCTC